VTRFVVSSQRRKPRFVGVVMVAAVGVLAVALLAAGNLAGSATTGSSGSHRIYTIYSGRPAGMTDDGDGRAVEVGVHFRASVAGAVVGVRFWNFATNAGTHRGSLWSTSGRRLATGLFTAEPRVGWTTLRFAKPVHIRAGTTYVASYHTNTGHYASEPGVFSNGATVGNHVLRATAGVYRYGGSHFPAERWHGSSYFVDVLFRPAHPIHHPSPSPSQSATSATGTRQVGCAPLPSRCGYPDATNTGVADGAVRRKVPGDVTHGTGWHWDSRGWVEIDGDGATFSGYSVSSGIDVTASNVTISGDEILSEGEGFAIGFRHTANMTISHNTIYSPVQFGANRLMTGIKDVFMDSTGTRILANNIYHAQTGVQIDAGLIQDNYIHDMGYVSGDHVNGTTSNAVSGSLSIIHNTVFNQFEQTDAVSLFEDFGAQYDRVINDNLVAGGDYAIYGGANPGGAPAHNIRITNNRISTKFFPHGGYFGPYTAVDPSGSGNVFTGNVWDATGAPVT